MLFRSKHFGQAICSTIISEAMKLGASHAYLQVKANNHGARKLYERLGFQYLYTYWFRAKKLF